MHLLQQQKGTPGLLSLLQALNLYRFNTSRRAESMKRPFHLFPQGIAQYVGVDLGGEAHVAVAEELPDAANRHAAAAGRAPWVLRRLWNDGDSGRLANRRYFRKRRLEST